MPPDPDAPTLTRRGTWAAGVDPWAVGATWLLVLLALTSLESQGPGLASLVGGGLLGAVLVGTGFVAAARTRRLAPRSPAQRTRLAAGALLLGVAVGAMNLGANVAMGASAPEIQALLRAHLADPPSWARLAAVAVVEEVAFRLVLMSVVAWGVSRLTRRPRTVFLAALAVSALLFAGAHLLGRPMPPAPAMAALYTSGVLLKSGLAGLVLGGVFWRWGLPYAMLCHLAANGLHTLLEPVLFA
ncbi:type II CAAX prenyl endopeptidase Rce1 family protein [Rubrivirga sp. IMCC45206]|uniref:CPBP family glutamic-type intramembrane protease n=1 Tax=Rubrivirga sp. IMCC45206 TaxID=3391614 RepID=UPI0039902D8A